MVETMVCAPLRRVLAVVAFLCAANPAIAQAPARNDSWNGPYVGLMLGAGIGHTSVESVVGCPITGFLCNPTQYLNNGALLSALATGLESGSGLTGGMSAGYNWQAGQFLSGIEADLSYLHLSMTRSGSAASLNLGLVNPGPVPAIHNVAVTAAIDWVASFRGRLGYLPSSGLLLFITGGPAVTRLSVSNIYYDDWQPNQGVGNSGVTPNCIGYAVGGGFEWNAGRGWTWRAEYLRLDFGAVTTTAPVTTVQFPAALNPYTSSANLSVDLFRSGFNFRF